MRVVHISELACPGTNHAFNPVPLTEADRERLQAGYLECAVEGTRIPIHQGIPRFVREPDYVASFGMQWNRFRRTQIDRFNHTTLSRDRLLSGTGWQRGDVHGARVLEVGCGAGRFTQVLLDLGAQVRAVDGSTAVEACYENFGQHPNLCIVQADAYRLPFQRRSFDKVFCYGVLQHTPDPARLFRHLVTYLKPGGEIAIDVYHRGWVLEPYKSKYLYRPLTTRMPKDTLFRLIQWYVPRWLPMDTWIKRAPVIGRLLGMLVPCWNYHYLPLSPRQREEWAVLDTFDALASTYDRPQTLGTVRRWFQEAKLVDVQVRLGGNGVLGKGRTSSS